jgi:uncharacterized protein YcfL
MKISDSFLNTIAGLTLAVACVSGCKTVNSVERAELVAQRQMVDDQRVLTDAGLNRRVRVVGVNESTGLGGLLKVQVELLNTTRSLQTFNYKFEWFDANGNLVSTPASAFLPRQIEGKESLFLAATAPLPSAKDFRLKLIENLR